MTESNFIKLASIDVKDKIEKKNGLSYLSWAWAWDQLLRQDPHAEFEYPEPTRFPDETVMVYCIVTAFGKQRKAHLPVMDYKNQPIKNPNAFAMNTAMQRCFVKAIALHGLGLYIYAGEDLPEGQEKTEDKFSPENKSIQSMLFTRLGQCKDQGDILSFIDEYQKQIDALPKEMSEIINEQIEIRSDCIKRGVPLRETEVHGFAGVNDAIAWAGKMFPLIETFKSLKTLDQWEEHNRPFINGLECLNAKKYKKDDNGNQSDTGKSPRERFLQALMDKRVQLESVNTLNQPIG